MYLRFGKTPDSYTLSLKGEIQDSWVSHCYQIQISFKNIFLNI
jgi:hypothetical protein